MNAFIEDAYNHIRTWKVTYALLFLMLFVLAFCNGPQRLAHAQMQRDADYVSVIPTSKDMETLDDLARRVEKLEGARAQTPMLERVVICDNLTGIPRLCDEPVEPKYPCADGFEWRGGGQIRVDGKQVEVEFCVEER